MHYLSVSIKLDSFLTKDSLLCLFVGLTVKVRSTFKKLQIIDLPAILKAETGLNDM